MKYTLITPRRTELRSEREFLKELKAKVQYNDESECARLRGVSTVDADHFGLLYEDTGDYVGVGKCIKMFTKNESDRLVDGWIGEQIF